MTTFLLAYNPKRWRWDDLKEAIGQLDANGFIETRWSCANSTQITVGAQLFIIRLGVEPKGIFASGYATSDWYSDLHWNQIRAANGETTHYVRVRLDKLLDPDDEPILALEELKQPPFSSRRWDIPGSGVEIPSDIAVDMFIIPSRWQRSAMPTRLTRSPICALFVPTAMP
jgi:5-methylcytosine-specific restriction protein A